MYTDVTTKSIKEKIRLRVVPAVFLVVGLAFIGTAMWAGISNLRNTSKSSPVPVEQLNQQFLAETKDWQAAAPSEQQQKLNDLLVLAKKRRAAMVTLLATNPDRFLELAIPPSRLAGLPADVQSLVEQETTATGTLVIAHADDFFSHTSSEQYALVTGDIGAMTETPVYFATLPAPHTTGATLSLAGFTLDGKLAVSGTAESTSILEPAVTTATGSQKVAIILINFQNDTRQPQIAETVRHNFFDNVTSTGAYYQEVSDGALALVGKNGPTGAGDVYGWVTLPYDNTHCNYFNWSNDANAIIGATALAGYDYYVYNFPATANCPWGGLGYLGGNWSWVNGQIREDSPYVTTHELGHNLNTHHASSLSCTDGPGGPRRTISSTCTVSEYGDPFDVMGIYTTNHFSNYRKGAFTWYSNPSQTVEVTNTGGSFTILPQEETGSGLRVLRVQRPNAIGTDKEFFYVEYRKIFGQFDHFNPGEPVVSGVAIRLGPGPAVTGSHSYLLDATPNTPPSGVPNSFTDSALPAGGSVSDPDTGITISVPSNGIIANTSATVTVTPACRRITQTLTPATSLQGGRPGTSVAYSLTIKNEDLYYCGTSLLTLTSAALPPGWTITVPTPNTFTLAPQETRLVSIIITSPPAATIGTVQSVPVTLSRSGSPPVIATMYYQVSNPPLTNIGVSFNSGATIIAWATDVLTNGILSWGLTSAYGLPPQNVGFSIGHAAIVTGSPNTTYHYSIHGCTQGGLCTDTPDATFTTPPALTITNPSISFNNGSAVAQWTTNVAANGTVYYNVAQQTHADFTTNHVVTFPVTANTFYQYQLRSCTQAGDCMTTPIASFTSPAPPANSNVAVSFINGWADVHWTTNTPASGVVNYGLTNQYGAYRVGVDYTTDHSVLLPVTNTTLYHFTIRSCLSSGFCASTPDATFTSGPGLSNIATVFNSGIATISWQTDVATDSLVNYGLTSSYGSSRSSPAFTTTHSVTIPTSPDTLSPGTVYHYSIRVCTQGGICTSTLDAAFTTPSGGGGGVRCGADQGLPPCLLETQ